MKYDEYMSDDIHTPKVLELVERLINEDKKPEATKILQILGFKL